MKITPISGILGPVRERHANKGVTLKLQEHSDRVRDIERGVTLDYWNKMGVFKVVRVGNLVVQSTGSSQMLTLNQNDVKIEVIEDNQWKDFPSGVRHSHIDYLISYSYAGQIIDFTGDGAVPEGIENIPKGIVPENTNWS